MKVYELAKELDIGAIDLVEKLKSLGMNVRNHMVSLSDEELVKAREAYTPSEEEKTSVKKVVKKKAAKKKTAKKASASKKVVTVKRKAKTTKKKVAKSAEEASSPESQVIGPEVDTDTTLSQQTSESFENTKKEYLDAKESLHTFTPVFTPETSEDDDSRGAKEEKARDINDDVPLDEIDSRADKDEKSKKRLGGLAAMVSKKGVSRSQDIQMLRVEEEMKLASTVVGRTVYTPAKKKKVYTGATKQTEITEVKASKRVVHLHDGALAGELADKLSQKFESFANTCLQLNLLVKPDDYIGMSLASEIAALYDYRVENKAFDEAELIAADDSIDKEKLPLRNPIITVMGHVDHGKTTLLDYIRKAKVASGEAGGITQHIGAYSVDVKKTRLTFLDTPGHAAFGAMRQRGANVTDVVILVVAADDGVMPQTKESIRFCKNANVPIIVAVNKMDKEGANPEKVKQELMEFELTPEEWGGDTLYVPVSALTGDGVDSLLETVSLQAEMMELRADPKGRAKGVVIESKIEQGRGAVATILVQEGTLKKGDSVVVGETWGRARSLMDSTGVMLKEAGPSMPVQVLGLNEAPSPGDLVHVVKNDKEAKKVVDNRVDERKALELASSKKVNSLEDFFADVAGPEGEKKTLNLIVRADVLGSFEAIKNSLESLGNDEVGVSVVGGGVGAIVDNDVEMAASISGYIIGFNMRPMTSARRLAEQKGVDVKTYSIIYELINDITLALEGMLEPEYTEKFIGRAQVKDTFNIPKIGLIAGSSVIDGKIERGCNIRLLRDGKIVFDGKLSSLKRFKDDVKEVKNGLECGIALEGFNDVKVDDLFEAYVLEEKSRKLDSASGVTL